MDNAHQVDKESEATGATDEQLDDEARLGAHIGVVQDAEDEFEIERQTDGAEEAKDDGEIVAHQIHCTNHFAVLLAKDATPIEVLHHQFDECC